MNYTEGLHFLYSLADFERTGRFANRTDLVPVLTLLEELDNPQVGRLTVHIAGSKGKGSVAAMCESVLRAAKRRTGLFTSPHLNRFVERIQIDGQPVTTEKFAEGLTAVAAAAERVRDRLPDRNLVTFDALTALGFYIFREENVEAQVIEVGLGGLLDSTNVFENKECSVITNIGLEHRDVLGETVAEISRQKAGIIISGCPTIMAPQRETAAEVIREVAEERGSPLIEVAQVCNLRSESSGSDSQKFRLRTPAGAYEIKLPLLGKHQLDNAATAALAIESLTLDGAKIEPQAIKAGLESVRWPARIETIKHRPLVVVDAAHTADSARRLRDTMSEYLKVDGATLIVGLMGDKDIEGLTSAIEPLARRVIVTKADHPRALDPDVVARSFRELSVETLLEPKLDRAIDLALNLSTPSDAVVILGSVALAGEARAYILGLERDPQVIG